MKRILVMMQIGDGCEDCEHRSETRCSLFGAEIFTRKAQTTAISPGTVEYQRLPNCTEAENLMKKVTQSGTPR